MKRNKIALKGISISSYHLSEGENTGGIVRLGLREATKATRYFELSIMTLDKTCIVGVLPCAC